MQHEKFHYSSLKEVKEKAKELKIDLPLSSNTEVLNQPIHINGYKINNRLAIQPMEGCDGTADGRPDTLTTRRYKRFAESGAGIIWVEAVAVVPEGRANPRQLMLTEKNRDSFKSLIETIRETSLKENGFEPLLIMQATHSGRYSKPNGTPSPVIAYQNPVLEKEHPLDESCIVSDDYLKNLTEQYAAFAKLVKEVGFDGVDIKACHRYLISELLSAYNRAGSYGGSFLNRTRLLRESIAAAKSAVSSSFVVTSRLNIYDGFPYPYGFGVQKDGGLIPDMSESMELVRLLYEENGVQLLNLTLGNPYANPHVNRPFDVGPYEPEEHPLEGVARMCSCIGEIKQSLPQLTVISSGTSYLRQFSLNLAAGMLKTGQADIAGFGREAFAYPDFAKDILKYSHLDGNKCCITCSKCSQLMRAGSTAGCVIRDSEVYLPIYKRDVMKIEKDH
ncbi:oxidoreductase [Anaerocolumna sp. MB42-C2]|uniref:oxidoreductase n=1 Tax=Anaerocolumna sp. MB42-C2 TaxID=3070997 RepID=UPI0027DFB6E3|nr:flavin oxidoreductase/NADH oxidase [Anaerocolumna sp. MB42-C2]WMJ86695.1 flavin oxidoreductase/NADH oxidase [Anaerocolumna sp. MB42-C2]